MSHNWRSPQLAPTSITITSDRRPSPPPLCRKCGETDPECFLLRDTRTLCRGCRARKRRGNRSRLALPVGLELPQCGRCDLYHEDVRDALCPWCLDELAREAAA